MMRRGRVWILVGFAVVFHSTNTLGGDASSGESRTEADPDFSKVTLVNSPGRSTKPTITRSWEGGISIEILNTFRREHIAVPSSISVQAGELNYKQIAMLLWLRAHADEIAAAEAQRHVSRMAIAGVIAWEGLENAHPVWSSVESAASRTGVTVPIRFTRFVGPGKVHFCNLSSDLDCQQALVRTCGSLEVTRCSTKVTGLDETVAQEVEVQGYLKRQSLKERVELLQTSSGAILYVGAILQAGADAAKIAGWDIHDKPGVLAEFYRRYTLHRWREALAAAPRDRNGLVLLDHDGKPINDLMAEWVEHNRSFLEDAVGPSTVDVPRAQDTIGALIPYDGVQARNDIQAEVNSYEFWLAELERTVSRAEETRRKEKEDEAQQQELLRQGAAFGYIAAAAKLACADPENFLAEVKQGRYAEVGMDTQYLTLYLGSVSPGKGVSECQFQLLKRINDSPTRVTWRQLDAWGSEYRAAHPTLVEQAGHVVDNLREAFRTFLTMPTSSESRPTTRPTPRRQTIPPPPRQLPPEGPALRQLRGMVDGD